MQSNGNSFGGDVVLDSFNMAYKGDDSILYLYLMYEKQIFSGLYYEDYEDMIKSL